MPALLLNLTEDSRRRVFSEESWERLLSVAETVRFDPKTESESDFRVKLDTADAMLTCWGSRPLSATDLSGRTGRPLFVAHVAGSVRGVVSKDLLTAGVRLTQGAPAIALAVAHYTIGLISLALRQAYHRMQVLKGTAPKDSSPVPYYDLDGITVGLIGLSRVGTHTAELLRPFGSKVMAYDPYASSEKAASLGVELVADVDELLTRSQVVSLHAPVTDETRNLLDARRIALLKPGSVVINTARAALVDQDALFGRAIQGELEVYVDVTTPEPLPTDHPAWQSSHIFITPHIAGPTRQSLQRMADYAIAELERYFRGEPLLYEVTHERYDLLA